MSRWIGRTDSDEWSALFTGFRVSAYRLECQQVYCSPVQDASLARFLAGLPLELDLSWTTSRTREQAAVGRSTVKVRIVVEPPTPYTRLELAVYPQLMSAGEDIRVVAVQQGDWPEQLPHHDYWLFDDQEVWRLHYHENFHFKGAELLDDPDKVTDHRRWRDIALAHSVPLEQYVTSGGHRGKEQASA